MTRYGVDPAELQTCAASWREAAATVRAAGTAVADQGAAITGALPDARSGWIVSTAIDTLRTVLDAQAQLLEGRARGLDLAAEAYGRADAPVPR